MKDYLIRGLAFNDEIRFFVTKTTDLVEEISGSDGSKYSSSEDSEWSSPFVGGRILNAFLHAFISIEQLKVMEILRIERLTFLSPSSGLIYLTLNSSVVKEKVCGLTKTLPLLALAFLSMVTVYSVEGVSSSNGTKYNSVSYLLRQ